MPYCLYCGKLRRTDGGLCRQCSEDLYLRRKSDAQTQKVGILLREIRARRGDANGEAES